MLCQVPLSSQSGRPEFPLPTTQRRAGCYASAIRRLLDLFTPSASNVVSAASEEAIASSPLEGERLGRLQAPRDHITETLLFSAL